MEYHYFVHPVNELGAEMRAHYFHDRTLHGFVVLFPGLLLDDVRAQVGGHHDDRIPEINRAALAICKAAVFQHLQQDIEDVRMGFFHLIQQQH